jgi:hypothetical protein
MAGAIQKAIGDYSDVTGAPASGISKIADDLSSSPEISGDKYLNMRSQLGKTAQSLRFQDPAQSAAYDGVQDQWSGGSQQRRKLATSKPSKRGYNGIDYVPHDARVPSFETGRTRIETMIGPYLRKPSLVANHHVDDGINAVKLMLPRATFNATKFAPGIEALRQYVQEWDDNARVFKKAPKQIALGTSPWLGRK